MEKFRVVGLMLAVFLCVITSEFACDDGSRYDPEAHFDFGNDLETKLSNGSWKEINCCSTDCRKSDGVVLGIDIRKLCPMDSESCSTRYGFWELTLATFKEVDIMELVHQVLAITLACSFMMPI